MSISPPAVATGQAMMAKASFVTACPALPAPYREAVASTAKRCSRLHVLAILYILLFLLRSDGGWPATFDESQHRPDLGVGEHLLIGWHGTAIAWRRVVSPPVLHDFEQPLIGMMPAVAALIVWRGRKVAQG